MSYTGIWREQDPPFAVQLEPVEGCSLACSFCGIQSIRKNGADAMRATHGKNSAPYCFMDIGVVRKIARDTKLLDWNPRWEFAMHGEPSMHPNLPLLVRAVRAFHKTAYILVTSNGSGLFAGDRLSELMAEGVNTLALDDYVHAPNWVDRAVQKNIELDSPYPVYRYPENKAHSPHTRHSGQKIVVVKDISVNTTGTHQLTNQGGNSFTSNDSMAHARCAKPFRELSVRWDGNVALCCDDWPGRYKVGNILEMDLHELWNHPKFEAARRKLYAGQRDFGPCKGCDVRSNRVGLLPDKFGKQEMPAPDASTDAAISSAMRGKMFTLKLVP